MIVNEPVPDTFEDTPAKDRDPEWFKRAVFYEVLVRSFQDPRSVTAVMTSRTTRRYFRSSVTWPTSWSSSTPRISVGCA